MSGQTITMDAAELERAVANAVNARLSAAAPNPAPAPAAAPAGMMPAASFGSVVSGPWGAPAMPMMPASSMASGSIPQPTGIALKMKLQLPDGSAVPFDLQLPAEAANPQALQAIVMQMVQAGWPITVYEPRNNGFGRGGGFGGGRGRWNGGGYGRGGRY